MLQRIFDYIKENKMICPHDKVVLGISGGADSVCLLFVLLEYMKIVDFSLEALHINHMIRGDEADGDEQFVIDLCKKNRVPYKIVRINIPQIAREKGLGLEEAARIERYRLFDEVGADKIAVAHHKNDRVETMLFNLVRGTGLKGLCSVKPISSNVIRPLLCVGRDEIEEYLREKTEYCTDSTNEDTDYSRNRIRNEIIPQFNLINAQAVSHMDECIRLISEAEEYLSSLTDKKCEEVVFSGKISIEKLKNEPEILQKRIVKKVIEKAANHSKDITAQNINAVLSLTDLQSGKKVNLPYNLIAQREYNDIVIKKNNNINSGIQGELIVNHITPSDKNAYPKEAYTKWFDYAKIKDGVVLRTRKTGDYICINGGTKKIQNLFTDLKIPLNERDKVPLLCDGQEVIWVIGYRINERYKVTEETNDIVEIIYGERRDGN